MENQINIQSNSNMNQLENMFSPIKDYNLLETPQIKSEGKFQIIPSPFINQITPGNKMDFSNIINQQNNGDTPNLISNSRVFSPFFSGTNSKFSDMRFVNLVSKNLMNEFPLSSFKPCVLYPTPNNNKIINSNINEKM